MEFINRTMHGFIGLWLKITGDLTSRRGVGGMANVFFGLLVVLQLFFWLFVCTGHVPQTCCWYGTCSSDLLLVWDLLLRLVSGTGPVPQAFCLYGTCSSDLLLVWDLFLRPANRSSGSPQCLQSPLAGSYQDKQRQSSQNVLKNIVANQASG